MFILGLVHGLTPDEHTWPVIFGSSLNQKRMQKAVYTAFFFALAATIPWIILAAIFSILGTVFYRESWEVYFHLVLGLAMLLLGGYALIYSHTPHFHIGHKKGHNDKAPKKPFNLTQIIIYGLILGLGPCAPVLLMYGFAAESQRLSIGIFSGLLFGLATMITLSILAAIFSGFANLAKIKVRQNLSKILSLASGLILILFGLYLIVEMFLK